MNISIQFFSWGNRYFYCIIQLHMISNKKKKFIFYLFHFFEKVCIYVMKKPSQNSILHDWNYHCDSKQNKQTNRLLYTGWLTVDGTLDVYRKRYAGSFWNKQWYSIDLKYCQICDVAASSKSCINFDITNRISFILYYFSIHHWFITIFSYLFSVFSEKLFSSIFDQNKAPIQFFYYGPFQVKISTKVKKKKIFLLCRVAQNNWFHLLTRK